MDKKRERFSCYSQRHIRRLIAQSTAINVDNIFEPTPGCSYYHVPSADENSPELVSQNPNDSTIRFRNRVLIRMIVTMTIYAIILLGLISLIV